MAEEITNSVIVEEQPTALEVPSTMKSLIEALIFAAKEPLSTKQIQSLYAEQSGSNGEARTINAAEIVQIVEELNAEFAATDKPYRIIQIAGGYQFATLSVYAEWLGKLYKEQSRRKLSQSSIETLSIIAYKQPISKPEIEAIRGVNCDYVLKTLLEKELVTIVGRAPTPGRPLLYGTTKEFLKHFGLNEVSDLPRPREIEEILGESQFEAERRMLEAQQGLDQPKKPEEDFKSRLPHIPKRKPELDESVKIVPKKRTRELKVHKKDEAQQHLVLEQPSTVTPEGEGAPQTPIVPEPGTADGVVSGTTEAIDDKVESLQIEEPADLAQEPNVLPEGSEKLFGTIDLYTDSQEQPEVSLEVEPESTTTESIEPINTEQEPMVSLDEKEGASVVEEQLELDSLATAGKTNEQESLQSVSKYPQIIDEQPPVDERAAPHPKSKWQSWKEKIQGFIKKLFG